MSEEAKLVRSIFDTENEEFTRSPEKIDEYIKVSSRRIWMFAAALCLLTAALFFWGFKGTIPVNVMMKGVGISRADLSEVHGTGEILVDRVICMTDAADMTSGQLDNKAAFVRFRDGKSMAATGYVLDTSPLADDEIKDLLSKYNVKTNWVLSQLGEGGFRYVLVVDLDEPLEYYYWGEVCDVSLTVDEIHPISLLFGNGKTYGS